MPSKQKAPKGDVLLPQFTVKEAQVFVIGMSPFLCNAMSEKAKRIILLPGGPINAATKKSRPKHNVLAEYRESPYMLRSKDSETLLAIKATAFKAAMRGVTKDMEGAVAATEVGRWCHIMGDFVPMWGMPELRMDVVRMADINKTPDVRTRACVREWATTFTVRFTAPMMRETMVAQLLAGAGFTQGVGDGRPEKGKMSCGMFRLCEANDPDWLRIVTTAGRKEQLEAMRSDNPDFYDEEAEKLYRWFENEAARRGFNMADTSWELGIEDLFSTGYVTAEQVNAAIVEDDD
jgi:hypothetical protein